MFIDKEVQAVVDRMPFTFRLRAFDGVFHIDARASFVSCGDVQLVIANEMGEHFCRCSVAELEQAIDDDR